MAFFLGIATYKELAIFKPVDEPIIKTDTLFVRDTIRITEPVLIKSETVDSLVAVVTYKDLLIDRLIRNPIHDTLYIQLPLEVKEYKDSVYHAQISGYKPNLDWIEIYPETSIVTITKEVEKKIKPEYTVGIDIGYGVTKEGLSPYIGLSLHKPIISFYKRKKSPHTG